MQREDIAALVTVLTMVVMGVILGWIGNRYRWGLLKSVFFIGLPFAIIFGLYFHVIGATLWIILPYIVIIVSLTVVRVVSLLVIGTTIGNALSEFPSVQKWRKKVLGTE